MVLCVFHVEDSVAPLTVRPFASWYSASARQEKRKQKEERRANAKLHRTSTPKPGGAEDPDIAGIVPGPQPWPDEFLTAEERALKNAPPKPSGASLPRAL
jgi:hypothetical protein